MTFGFDTAVSIATEALDRIATTAESHNRIMVVEVMGRTKGWIATYAGIAAGADAILVPEVEPDLDAVAATIRARHRHGRTYSIVVVAEGCAAPRGEAVGAGHRRVRVRAARRRRLSRRRRARAADRLRDAGHGARAPAARRHPDGVRPRARDPLRRRRRRPRRGRAVRRDGGAARRRTSSASRSPRRAPRCAASTRRCSTSPRRSSASRSRVTPPADRDRPRRHAAAVGPHRLRPLARPPRGGARRSAIEVVVATARSPRSARDLAADAGIGGIAICANGATLYDLDTDTVVAHTPLAAPTAHVLVRGLRERFPGSCSAGSTSSASAASLPTRRCATPDWWPRPDDAYEPCDPLEWTLPMTKLIARLPDADLEHVLAVAAELAGDDASTTLAGDSFVEMAAAGVGKEAALAAARDGARPRRRPTSSRSATTSPTRRWLPGPATASPSPTPIRR